MPIVMRHDLCVLFSLAGFLCMLVFVVLGFCGVLQEAWRVSQAAADTPFVNYLPLKLH